MVGIIATEFIYRFLNIEAHVKFIVEILLAEFQQVAFTDKWKKGVGHIIQRRHTNFNHNCTCIVYPYTCVLCAAIVYTHTQQICNYTGGIVLPSVHCLRLIYLLIFPYRSHIANQKKEIKMLIIGQSLKKNILNIECLCK